MKKLKLFFALFAMLALGVTNAWAEEQTGTISFASTAQRVSQDNNKQVWSNEGITFTNNKASSTTNVGNYSNPVRLYAKSNIVIDAPGKITKIEFTANSSSYATTLQGSIGNEATISGSKVTVTPSTSSENYTISSLSGQVRLNSLAVTYEAGSSTPTTTYTIKWHTAKGVTTDVTLNEGATITKPETDPTMSGYVFMGWTASCDVASEGSDFTALTDFGTADSDKDFYAVFAVATTTGGESTTTEVTDVLNRATTGVTNTTYTTWSGKTATSSAVYAGQSAGGNSSIQLRSSNSNSGIVTTASGGKATKISVEWNSNTSSGRTIDIYGKNSAYTQATDLYNSTNQGTKLGSIKCGTSTELAISGDYEYIGIRSNSGALYLTSVSIKWASEGTGGGTTTYDNYITTCGEETVVKTLQSIAVTDMTQIYQVGDAFSFDGKCTATYSVTKDGVEQAPQTAIVTPTFVSAPNMTQVGTQDVTVSYTEEGVTKTTNYAITIEEAPTYDFRKIDGFSNWESGYVQHVVEYSDAKVTFAAANKQTSTITDQPVTKGGDVSLVLTDGMNIATVKWVCTQWTTKAQTITLRYSKDGGVTYTSTGITSENFTISSDNLPAGTNAVKITFSSTSNQVGIKSCTITKVEAAAITQVPAPQFSLPAGAYDGAQSVELTCTMADATIHYTTDGTTPTTTSPVYSTAIQVAENMTIKAYAVKEGLEDSPVVEATYEISAPADVVLDFTTNDTWNFPTEKTVTATDYSNGDYTVTVAGSEGQGFMFDNTNKNLMIGKEGSYIVLPIFNKPIVKIVCEGVSSGSGSVTFNVFVDDEAVSTAVTSCKVDQTFLIAEDKQVANVAHVIKVTNAQNVRFSKIKIYLGEAPAVERPIIGGEEEFVAPIEVSITCATSGAKIYYTTDGTEPTNASAEYTTPFELSATTSVKAIAYADGQASAVATKTFTFIETITCVQAAAIALAQSANNVQTEKKYRIVAYVTETLSAVSSNQQSFKVVDNIGDESVFQSYYCNVPEAMAAGMKVEMIGKLSKYNTTAQMKNGDVTILEKPVAAPKILGADAFETSTEVTITAEEGMQIYYTLDGATPTTGSTKYTAAFTLSATTTVKAIAYNSATAKSSAVAEKTFTKTTISTKTIAEFIASQGGACYLEGIVSNIQNTQYGNFDLTDATGTIYIYGCLNANGEPKKFAELGVKEGDLLKVQANVYELYNEKHEAKNVVYVSHVSNSEEPEAPELPTTAENATFIFNTAKGLADLGIAYPMTTDGTGMKTDIDNNTTVISNGVGLTMTGGNTTPTRIWLTASGALDLRVYKGATLTFAVADGYEITKVVFDGSALANLAVGGVAVGSDTKTWEGSQKSVTFDVTDGVKINTIAVTVAYTRNVTIGKYGTICLPYGSSNYSGATFFEIAYQETGKVYIDEVATLEAGVPYIFQAKSSKLTVTYEGTPDVAKSKNGLYGTFTEIADVAAHTSNEEYILTNNSIRLCEANCNVPANRAYIVLDEISTEQTPAPVNRRRVGMSVQGENETTGVEDLFTTDAPAKVIVNGQLIIIRDGVKYNVQGQVIK